METLIHPNSKEIHLADFDMFVVPPSQKMIEKTITTEHRPIATLDPSQIIEFLVDCPVNECILGREILFYMEVQVDIAKVDKSDVDADDWKKVMPVNNWLHSMFKSVELEIGGKSVVQAPSTYPYKVYFETFLGHTDEAKTGWLSSSFHYQDEDKKEALNQGIAELLKPKTVKKEGTGKVIDLCGKLHLDLLEQPKALIGGVKLKFTFIPHNPNFYLVYDSGIIPRITWKNAALYVKKAKLIYDAVEGQNVGISKTPALYPILRTVVKPFTIQTGALDVSIDNAITGQIPRNIYAVMVDGGAYAGDGQKNPFNFQHFNINHFSLSLDGVQYPSKAFTPDFANSLFSREYLSIYDTLNQMTSDSCLSLSNEEYAKGNVIFGISLAQDQSDDVYKSGYVNPIQKGSISVNLKFSRALTSNINLLLYCEYDNMIKIDSTRTPFSDFF